MIGAFFFLIGLVIGSFLNVCIYRIPRGISIIKPSSFCPNCKRKISLKDNIPIISYILLRGKCRNCGRPISIHYPLVELITGLFSTLLYLKYGISPECFFYLIFTCSLIVLSGIDITFQILPDVITIPGILTGIVFSFFQKRTIDSITGAFLGMSFFTCLYLTYRLVTGKEGIGGGDIKLIGMIGAWLGVRSLFSVIFLGSASGAIFGILRRDLKKPIPFGPFLSAGAVFYLLTEISFFS